MNTNNTLQSLGGRKRAIEQRKSALELYYQNPKICKQCEQIIQIPENIKVSTVKKKIFCNKTCAAKFNGSKYPKRKAITEGPCIKCKKTITYSKRPSGSYSKRDYCEECLRILQLNNTFKRLKVPSYEAFENLSKKDLFSRRKNYQSFRGSIRRHACIVFQKSKQPQVCVVCGYKKHIAICHKKSVSSFNDDALIKDINNILNLVPLCLTHHWEYDNNELTLPV